jgi:dipeptidyl aminopeptidase/acylaminoacyl peptidase
MTFGDYYKIVGVSDARIAPDGKEIVVTVSRVNAKKDDYDSELVLVNAATHAQRVLTYGRDDVGDPQWSPDGTRLAFVAPAGTGEAATPQVFVLPMNGGDAQPVTHAKNGVETYAWRRDGAAIAYVTQDDAHDGGPLGPHDDLFKVGDDGFTTRKLPVPSHLWVQNLRAGSAPERLTEGAWSIYADRISWSADGRYIAFERLPGARFDDILHSRVAAVDVATKQVSVVGEDSWGLSPVFAPRGHELAFTQGRDHTFVTHQDPAVVSIGGSSRNPAPGLDRDVDFVDWTPDGSLLLGAADRTTRALWSASGGKVRRVDLGDVQFGGASVARNGAVALIGSTPTSPSELYYLAPGTNEPPVRMTDYNRAIADLGLPPTHEFQWQNDGFIEYGALTYPVGYAAGKKYPLVLVIHGGPTSEASTVAFSPLVQMLAAHGAFVLQPNYRGSDDNGFAYAHAIIGREPPLGPGTDVVAAVHALEARGEIDESRIGVSGWSAGGWLTSWLITHYDLFKAAVSGAAVDDAVMQYTLSQIDSYMPYLFGGMTPWNPGGLEAYRQSSPVTYAANVKAATLILSDTGDSRAPAPQAYEFFSALRDLGKTVEFVAIPANGHHPSDPVQNRAVDETWVGWMVQHLPLP